MCLRLWLKFPKLLSKSHLFSFPEKFHRVLTVKDAFKKGVLCNTDVPESVGVTYPIRKKEIMDMVPEGGYWRDLPDNLQREYT